MRDRLRLLATAILMAGCASDPTMVDRTDGGFAIYRSGRIDRGELAELCRRGVRELVVLDGTAGRRECRWRDEVCPDLVVRYDTEQQAHVPLDAAFLAAFDSWVEQARADDRSIAFRCRHGWHRAGRLTAWYRLRFSGWEAKSAIEEMLAEGEFMARHPYLAPQVEALAAYRDGRPCDGPEAVCVRSAGGEATPFPADVCP